MAKFDNKSFYKKTPNNGFFLSYYEPINIPYDSSDYYLEIPTKYDLKPGLLANDLYGDPQLLWIFSIMNRDTITDPLFDFRAGKIIRIPTRERLYTYI